MILFFITALAVILVIRYYVKGKLAKRVNMKGKIIIITGSSDGIGKSSAFQLLEDEATVIFACRNKTKTMRVIEETKTLGKECYERSHFIELDLSSFKSVDNFISEFKSKFSCVDILLNNAGFSTQEFSLTQDGLESVIQTNHFSHVKLTLVLLDYFNKKEGKIINVSALAHVASNYSKLLKTEFKREQGQFKNFFTLTKFFIPYANSKLANIYFTSYLSDLFNKNDNYSHLYAYSLHPGVIYTNFVNVVGSNSYLITFLSYVLYPLIKLFFKTSIDGAQTQLHLCYSDISNLKQGGYYSNCILSKAKDIALREDLRNYLMDETIKILDNKS